MPTMKHPSFTSSLLAAAALLVAAPLLADHHARPPAGKEQAQPAGKLVRPGDKDAAWLEAARKAYPLDTCLTSDEELGSMGKSPEYIYRVAGQPDRLVIFCCDGCDQDFLKEPAKYLAKLDAAAKDKAKPARKPEAHSGHHD